MEGVVILRAQYKVKSSDTAIVTISVKARPEEGEAEGKKRNGPVSVEEESKSPTCQKVLQG